MTPETKLKEKIKRYLKKLDQIFIWSHPTGVGKVRNSYIMSFGKVGSADLIGLAGPNGRFLAIETKCKRGQTPEQKAFQADIEARGGIYILAHCVEDVEKVFERENIIQERSLF